MKKKIKLFSILLMILLQALIQTILAQESNTELAKAAQNPLANLISFPFQNNTNFNYGLDKDRTQNLLNIQPVIPLKGGRIITRTIFPLLWQPEFGTEGGTAFGLADVNFTAFYAPHSQGATWGFGPILTIPTGYQYSSGKWGIGPSLSKKSCSGVRIIFRILLTSLIYWQNVIFYGYGFNLRAKRVMSVQENHKT
jgi:hypothetical protein